MLNGALSVVVVSLSIAGQAGMGSSSSSGLASRETQTQARIGTRTEPCVWRCGPDGCVCQSRWSSEEYERWLGAPGAVLPDGVVELVDLLDVAERARDVATDWQDPDTVMFVLFEPGRFLLEQSDGKFVSLGDAYVVEDWPARHAELGGRLYFENFKVAGRAEDPAAYHYCCYCCEDPCCDDLFPGTDWCCCLVDCDDDNACTQDLCEGGECSHPDVDCDDGSACTEDLCDSQDGCQNPIKEACIDDGNPCNGHEHCAGPEEGCKTDPLDCDDQNACTEDLCDSQDGCQNPIKQACIDDGNPCNGHEHCAGPEEGCKTDPLDCDDQNACTEDLCDSQDGCQNPIKQACIDDGNPCNGREHCAGPEEGCETEPPEDCDDDNKCNGTETCDPQSGCQPGDPLVCDDGDDCDGVETCDPQDGCQDGTPMDCDDQNVCTQDSCDNGECYHAPLSGVPCPNDGQACTHDVCHNGVCTHPCKDPCTPCGLGNRRFCYDCSCVAPACGLSLSADPDPVIQGGTVDLLLTVSCSPECGGVDWSLSHDGQVFDSVSPSSGSTACPGGSESIAAQVRCDAPVGPATITANGTGPGSNNCSTNVTVNVVKGVDLDVDSNNDGTIDPDDTAAGTDDPIEDDPGLTGLTMPANDDDDDNDGIPDYVDGYDLDGDDPSDDDATQGEDEFFGMVFELGGQIDLDVAKVQVTYEASAPADATVSGDSPPEVTLPAGRLRIWTRQGGGATRNPAPVLQGGDYLAPDTYTPAQLGLTAGDRDIDLWLEGVRPSPAIGGDRIVFNVDYEGDDTFDCDDAVRVTLFQVDLDTDADRDGQVEDTYQDDVWENRWEYGSNGCGAIILCNNDDDDDSHTADMTDSSINSQADRADLATLIVRGVTSPPLDAGWTMELRAPSSASRIRVFDADTETAVVGPTAGDTYAIPGPITAEHTFLIEATCYPGDHDDPQFDGLVTVSIWLRDPTGRAIADDMVDLRVAPFILLPNTATPELVYVSDVDASFYQAIESLAGVPGTIPVHACDTNGCDVWTQDPWELGFSSWPGSGGQPTTMPEAFETMRQGRPLEAWGRQDLLGQVPDNWSATALIERQGSGSNPSAFGGNLEVTPPLPDYPLGRIIVGQTMPAEQKAFLDAQDMQTPLIELDTGWLRVGHVDEFMAVIPGAAGGGSWQVVLASPQLAWDRMAWVEEHEPFFYGDPADPVQQGLASGGTPTTLIDDTPFIDFTEGPPWRYVRIYDGTGAAQVAEIDPVLTTPTEITVTQVWRFTSMLALRNAIVDGVGVQGQPAWYEPPQSDSAYVLVPTSKMWHWYDQGAAEWLEFPALIARYEVARPDFWTKTNEPAQNHIQAQRAVLEAALAGAQVGFVEVPAIFLGREAPDPLDAFAFFPGFVNLQVWNSACWLPRAFGPRLPVGREDTFQIAAESILNVGSRTTHFIDDWDTYHRDFGEVHCGTNVLREPPQSPKDHRQWWLFPPN